MANKHRSLIWILPLIACALGAIATLATGVVFALSATKTGVVGRVAVILSAVSLGLAMLSAVGLWLTWRRLRRG